jgi:tetratricopeptide (TPR) repeat protein
VQAAEYYRKFPDNFQLGMSYVRALMKNQQYAQANNILQNLQVLPAEGATDGRRLYRETQLMLAAEEIKKKNYKKALNYIHAARQWPEHLGAGKPYQEHIDERLEDWLAYEVHTKLGDENEAQKMLDKIETFTPVNDAGNSYANANELIRAWALQQKGRSEVAEKLLQDWVKRDPNNAVAQWVMNAYKKNASVNANKTPADEDIRLLIYIKGWNME